MSLDQDALVRMLDSSRSRLNGKRLRTAQFTELVSRLIAAEDTIAKVRAYAEGARDWRPPDDGIIDTGRIHSGQTWNAVGRQLCEILDAALDPDKKEGDRG